MFFYAFADIVDHIFMQLYQDYAIPFDLADFKLLCIHVSEHRDESIVRPIWTQIFDEVRCCHQICAP